MTKQLHLYLFRFKPIHFRLLLRVCGEKGTYCRGLTKQVQNYMLDACDPQTFLLALLEAFQ